MLNLWLQPNTQDPLISLRIDSSLNHTHLFRYGEGAVKLTSLCCVDRVLTAGVSKIHFIVEYLKLYAPGSTILGVLSNA